MKQSQIVLLGIFLLVSGVIYFSLRSNQKTSEKKMKNEENIVYVPTKKVKNTMRSVSMTSYGQVSPVTQLMVAFEVQGKLQKGAVTMKPGTNFSKGQILYTIDRQEAFFSLSARKSVLSTMILNALPDLELDFPSEKNKWIQFLNDLNPAKRLPELPQMMAKEGRFITSRNIISEYYAIKSQELRLDKYVYVAPFNGTVITVYAEPGSVANPGVQIAQIARTGNLEVKVPISMDDLALYKKQGSATFTDASGKKVAKGRIVRISNVINQQTQSADVYYSVSAIPGETIYHGMHLNVSISRTMSASTVTLPRTAVKDGMVNRLEGNHIQATKVQTMGTKPDSVFVSGLTDGSTVVLEQMQKTGNDLIFKGIER